jgi:hypothetical protein
LGRREVENGDRGKDMEGEEGKQESEGRVGGMDSEGDELEGREGERDYQQC